MKRQTTTAALLLLPCLAVAQEAPSYVCTNGDLTRRVEVIYETGVTVPCEVHYFKDTEAPGESQVLWRALNEAGYCEAQAESFVGKLRGWGWDCNASASSPMQDEPMQSDDTEALAPSEDDGEAPRD